MSASRRMRLRWWAFTTAFIVIPLVELTVIFQAGELLGWPLTLVLLLVDGLIGSWLVKREGRRAWAALTTALQSGRMPANELADGALILVGGVLMLTPGFVTDGVGLLLVLPLTRPVARRVLARIISRRLLLVGPTGPGSPRPDVVRGDVLDED